MEIGWSSKVIKGIGGAFGVGIQILKARKPNEVIELAILNLMHNGDQLILEKKFVNNKSGILSNPRSKIFKISFNIQNLEISEQNFWKDFNKITLKNIPMTHIFPTFGPDDLPWSMDSPHIHMEKNGYFLLQKYF